ncbi:delta(1)-pyrroline-2-carboxylate reductase family protein [Oxalobacteraceae bacterium OM1]|nr:delta(1)-pyrroline-2-carboxylate reductase family protein [Oxalobacteraceae bacterium OM1]
MRILTPQDTARALPYGKLIEAIAEAAAQLAAGTINAPDRLVVPTPNEGVLLCMPAVAPDIAVTKLITVHNDNPRRGLPAIQGEVTVFDAATGKRHLLLDGPTVTARRTAAVTLLGIQRLRTAAPTRALLIGTGVQAAAHADALATVFPLSELRVASRDVAQAQRFCAEVAQLHPALRMQAVAVADLQAACQDVDVVIALTTATTPVIPEQLPPATLAAGVGAFKPTMAELPAALLHARRIVVDHVAGAQHEAGDLLRAGIDWSRVQDLTQAAPDGGPAVLKTVGHAAWDLAAARVALATAG